MIGKTLRHFRVEAELGRGGMGEVYRARDEHLDRDVALKVLPAAALADETTRKRFRKEALALSKLNHPNIATIHEFDTQDGIDFLVMEYVAGKTLKDMLSEGGLPEKEAAKLGAQVATALEEAHEKGVIHRDLKPSNVMVTPKGQVKVLDFGIAKLVRPEGETTVDGTATETHGAPGTLPYMAPEQLLGEEVDGRTDLYALGTVLYEMATGRRTYRQTSAPQMIAAILDREPQTPRDLNRKVSSEFERIILKCLEKDPKRRPQTARELRADLERLSEPGPGAAFALLLRKPQVVIPVLLLLLAIAVGVGWWNRRNARILWAKQEALPEIERLVETNWRDFTVPYKLAEEAEK